MRRNVGFYGFFKRSLDILLSGGLLCFLAPLLAFLALRIRKEMGSPVLFRQTRPGLREVPFEMVKFRTMTDARSRDGTPLPDGDRLTPLGRFLRSTSLDELPELLNVLRGDMSLVGPRPLLPEYLPLYSPRQRRRHEVRPGITGWAQIHGRNAVDWETRLEMDVWYVEHRSFLLDLRILARTLFTVLRRSGIEAPGHDTMPRFTGTKGENRP